MTKKAPTSRRLTRYLAGPALALGLAIGSAAVANAEQVWDIEIFDACMGNMPRDLPLEDAFAWGESCCANSGGIWKPGTGCYAPGVDSLGRNPMTSAPTHVMQPSPLPSPRGDIGPAQEEVG